MWGRVSDSARVPPPSEAANRREERGLRNWVEARAQYIEDLVRAIAEERAHRSREAFEARAQEAGIEAKAYADQGLHVQASALRALGRVVADLSRQNRELARDRDVLTDRLAKCEAGIDRIAREGGADGHGRAGGAAVAQLGPFLEGDSPRLQFDGTRTPLPGFVNIDLSAYEDAAVVARVKRLRLRAGSVQEIIASQVVERVTAPVLSGSLLPFWRECLADDGRLTLTCRDGEALRAQAGGMSFEAFRAAVIGGGDGALRNWVTPEQLQAMLERAGFVDVEVLFRGLPRSDHFIFEVTARKRVS